MKGLDGWAVSSHAEQLQRGEWVRRCIRSLAIAQSLLQPRPRSFLRFFPTHVRYFPTPTIIIIIIIIIFFFWKALYS
jgi:hypothetical protein